MRQPQSSVLPISPPSEAHDPPPARPNVTERIAGWSARHRKTAVFGWLLLVAAIFMGGQALGTRNLPAYDAASPGRRSGRCSQVAPAQYGSYAENVLIQATTPGATFATDPAMRQAAAQVAASLAALPRYATDIRTPLSAGDQALVSKDGRSALVTFSVPGNVSSVDQAATTLQHAVAGVQAKHPDLRIAESGDASIGQAIDSSLNFSKAEATSVPITLILLLIVFGALVAAGIPVLLAVTALTAAIGVLTIVSHWLPVGSSTFEVVVIIGMAVGVDYSLFYLRREREERAAGRSFPDALRIAARTSGRTIVVSGLTVMATMAGLLLGRRRPVQRHRARHDRRGRHRGGRLADRAARAAGLARAEGGRRPDPVPRPQAGRRPAVPAVGGAGPPGGRQAADLGRHRGDRACSRWPRPRSACGSASPPSTRRRTPRWSPRWTRSTGRSRRPRRPPRSW